MLVTMQFAVSRASMLDALEAIKPYNVGSVKIFEAIALPKLPSDKLNFEKRAREIALWIQPLGSQSIRKEALEFVLFGSDTWHYLKGEPDLALRAAIGALSRRLRKFAPYDDSPLEILAHRRREAVPNGPYKGQYQGTRYEVTKLGQRVCEILLELGAISRGR